MVFVLLLLLERGNAEVCKKNSELPLNITNERFSLEIWSNKTNGIIFQSDSDIFNVYVSNNTEIAIRINNVTELKFPPFSNTLFPGVIVVSFFKLNWYVYSLHSVTCSSLERKRFPIAVPPFSFSKSSPDTGGVIHILIKPPIHPIIDDLIYTCKEQDVHTYSDKKETNITTLLEIASFPESPQVYFDVNHTLPVVYGDYDVQFLSWCKYPRKRFFVHEPIILKDLHIGSTKVFEENVDFSKGIMSPANLVYGNTSSNYSSYRTFDEIPFNSIGLVEKFITANDWKLYQFTLLPSIDPMSSIQFISVDDFLTTLNVSFVLETTNVFNDSRYYFRHDGELILPGTTVDLTIDSLPYVYSFEVITCNLSRSGMIQFISNEITVENNDDVLYLENDYGIYPLKDYLKLDGNPNVTVEATLVTTNGYFAGPVCNCSSFTFTGILSELNELLGKTFLILPNEMMIVKNYDGTRLLLNGKYIYLIYTETRNRKRSFLDRTNDESQKTMIVSISIIITFFIGLVLTFLYKSLKTKKK